MCRIFLPHRAVIKAVLDMTCQVIIPVVVSVISTAVLLSGRRTLIKLG